MEIKVLCFKANEKNFEQLKTLFPDDYCERFRQFSDREIDIYAVQAEGQTVGRIVANYRNQHLENETKPNVRACLSHFILLKAFRKRGLGGQLLDYAIKDLIVHGYKELTVGVEAENDIAKHLYFRNGFLEKINHGSMPCEYDLYLKRTE